MKKKRNLYIVAFLCFITLVGVTIAYLQSTDTFENIFNAGTYKTVTHEEFTSPTNWTPGDETPKTITTTNEGTIPVRVRVKLEENWKNSNNEELPLEFADSKKTSLINLDNEVDWILKGGYYYYTKELAPGETTSSLIKSVTFNPEYEGNVTCNFNTTTNSNECSSSDEYMGGVYTLNITTETVQADAYETLWENVPIMYDYVGDNPCTYEGELVPGAEYVNGQYTYKYRQEKSNSDWKDITDNGWGVILTDKASTDPVTTTLCSSVNNKPLVSMRETFSNSNAVTLDLSSFDTTNVTIMVDMFSNTKTNSVDISNFNTSKVIYMARMFGSSKANNININNLDTSNVTDMSMMFAGSKVTSLDLSSFDTSKVKNMMLMFYESDVSTLDLSNFDTSKVTEMRMMFWGCSATTIDLSSFDTSNVVNMAGMFYNSQAITLDLSSFDTSKVTSMRHMFYNSQATSLDLSSFDTSNVNDTTNMFQNAAATTGYARTQADADKFNSSSNKPSTLTFVVKSS